MYEYLAVFLTSILSLMIAINIDTADITALAFIKGIGPSKAGTAIAYRKKHGRFESIKKFVRIDDIDKKILGKSNPLLR